MQILSLHADTELCHQTAHVHVCLALDRGAAASMLDRW